MPAHSERMLKALKYVPYYVRRYARLKPGHLSWEEACQEAALGVCLADQKFVDDGPASYVTYINKLVKYRLWEWIRQQKVKNAGLRMSLDEVNEEEGYTENYAQAQALQSIYAQIPDNPEEALLTAEDHVERRRHAMRFISDLPKEWRPIAENVAWGYGEAKADFRSLVAIARREERTDEERALEEWKRSPEAKSMRGRYASQMAKEKLRAEFDALPEEKRDAIIKREIMKERRRYAKKCSERAARRMARRLAREKAA